MSIHIMFCSNVNNKCYTIQYLNLFLIIPQYCLYLCQRKSGKFWVVNYMSDDKRKVSLGTNISLKFSSDYCKLEMSIPKYWNVSFGCVNWYVLLSNNTKITFPWKITAQYIFYFTATADWVSESNSNNVNIYIDMYIKYMLYLGVRLI